MPTTSITPASSPSPLPFGGAELPFVVVDGLARFPVRACCAALGLDPDQQLCRLGRLGDVGLTRQWIASARGAGHAAPCVDPAGLADWLGWAEPAFAAAAVAAIGRHLGASDPEADEDRRREGQRLAAVRDRVAGGRGQSGGGELGTAAEYAAWLEAAAIRQRGLTGLNRLAALPLLGQGTPWCERLAAEVAELPAAITRGLIVRLVEGPGAVARRRAAGHPLGGAGPGPGAGGGIDRAGRAGHCRRPADLAERRRRLGLLRSLAEGWYGPMAGAGPRVGRVGWPRAPAGSGPSGRPGHRGPARPAVDWLSAPQVAVTGS